MPEEINAYKYGVSEYYNALRRWMRKKGLTLQEARRKLEEALSDLDQYEMEMVERRIYGVIYSAEMARWMANNYDELVERQRIYVASTGRRFARSFLEFDAEYYYRLHGLGSVLDLLRELPPKARSELQACIETSCDKRWRRIVYARSTSLRVPTRRATSLTRQWWGRNGRLEDALRVQVIAGKRPLRVWLPPETLSSQTGGYEKLVRSMRQSGFLSQEIAHVKIGIDTVEAPWFYLWEYGIPGGYSYKPRRRFPKRVFEDKLFVERRGIARIDNGEYRRLKMTPGRHGFRDLRPYDIVLACLKTVIRGMLRELNRRPRRFTW